MSETFIAPETLTFFCPNCGMQHTVGYALTATRFGCERCANVLDVWWHMSEKGYQLSISVFSDVPQYAVTRTNTAISQPSAREEYHCVAA